MIRRRPRPRAPSLLGRVFVRMSVTMFGAIALVLTALYVEFVGHMDSLRDRSLSGQAADVARRLEMDDGGGIRVNLPPGLAAAYADSGRYRYVVLDEDGRLRAASPGATPVPEPEPSPAAPAIRYFSSLDPVTGRSFYGASSRHAGPAGPVIVQVQQTAEHEDVVMDTFLDELGDKVLWIVVAVFASILLVTWFTLRASLSTLDEVSRQAAAIGPESLDRRLNLVGVPAEISPIVAAVNAAMERLEEAFHQQRRFTADAAHEMRTPIAVLRAHLDTLAPGEARALARDLGALDRVVAQLLRLAQADSMTVPSGSSADLHSVALDVAQLMGPAAINRKRSVALTGDHACRVSGDEDALEMALRNLVENALRHTPEETEVEIRVDARARCVCVLDRGPGVAPEERDQIFQRFWRGSSAKGDGAGLGLSIVARVASAHGASLRVEEREGGGAVFCMCFPA